MEKILKDLEFNVSELKIFTKFFEEEFVEKFNKIEDLNLRQELLNSFNVRLFALNSFVDRFDQTAKDHIIDEIENEMQDQEN